jgi:hypothetical protein
VSSACGSGRSNAQALRVISFRLDNVALRMYSSAASSSMSTLSDVCWPRPASRAYLKPCPFSRAQLERLFDTATALSAGVTREPNRFA